MTRSFESTGPDVKIRGTASHIAEKYLALARDAQSSGDPVLAENYLQHAEHYNRIIMAFREQQMAQSGGDLQNGSGHRSRPFGETVSFSDDFTDEEPDEVGGDIAAMPQPMRRHEGQPRHNEGARHEDRGQRMGEGQPRQQGRERQSGYERGERQERDRDRGGRHDRNERLSRPERAERPEMPDRPQPQQQASDQNGEAQQTPRRAAIPHHEQPEFLRRPVRRPRRESSVAAEEGAAPAPAPAAEDGGPE